MRRLAALGVFLGAVALGCTPPPQPPGFVPATVVLARITVATPNFTGYNRDLFGYPDDADHDCFDTRAEVVQRDSSVNVTANSKLHDHLRPLDLRLRRHHHDGGGGVADRPCCPFG